MTETEARTDRPAGHGEHDAARQAGLLRPLWPRRIGGQIALIALGSVALSQLVSFVLFAFVAEPRRERDIDVMERTGTLVAAIRMIAATTDTAERQAVVAAAERIEPALELALVDETFAGAVAPPKDADRPPVLNFVERRLGDQVSVVLPPGSGDANGPLLFGLPGGSFVSARFPSGQPPPPPHWFGIANIIVFLIVLLPFLLFWAVSGLARQLRAFERAATDFDLDRPHAPLPMTGPQEIRTASSAFNRMRDRIARLAGERTQMLGAIGHDLRTPITRLRLRAETIEDRALRDDMMRDLARMNTMVDSVLCFLRDGHVSRRRDRVDLSALLMSVCDEFADTGRNIECSFASRFVVPADAESLMRVFENLLGNAFQHGERAVVTLEPADDGVTVLVVIDDDGPGMPRDFRDHALEPFVRGDPARGGSDNGFGLGLSIANSIVTAHGGRIEFATSPLDGLRATVRLPLLASPAP